MGVSKGKAKAKAKPPKRKDTGPVVECAGACAESDGFMLGPFRALVRVDRRKKTYAFIFSIDSEVSQGDDKLKAGETALELAKAMVRDHATQSFEFTEDVTWELAAAPLAEDAFEEDSVGSLTVSELAGKSGSLTETLSNVDEDE